MQLTKGVKFRKERFGAVLFHTETERVFTLNPSAAATVEEIKSGRDENAVIAAVKGRFADPHDAIGADVRCLLAALGDSGLITARAT